MGEARGTNWGRVLVLLALLGAAIVWGYRRADRGTQKIVDATLGATVIGKAVIPWPDRAASHLKTMMSGPSAPALAGTVQSVLHPTGKSPRLRSYDIRVIGSTVSATFTVDWRGGVLGGEKTSVVRWSFSDSNPGAVVVMADDGAFGVGTSNQKRLADWFATEVYSKLQSSVDH